MTELFQTILYMSVSAGILALLILGARLLFGRRQTMMLTVLFALLIAKLVIPLSIESTFSVQNLLNPPQAPGITVIEMPQSNPAVAVPGSDPSSAAVNIGAAEDPLTPESAAPAMSEPSASPAATVPNRWTPSAMDIAAIVWLAGVAALTLTVAYSNIHFMRRLKKNRTYASPGFDALLQSCKTELRIHRQISVIQVSEIHTAAVYGIIKPKLLISPPTFQSLSPQEQRHVLLHELSHIKRKDTLLSLITTVLNIVHWFNPILWAAFILMRKDLEVMCDAKVLKKLDVRERHDYAATLLGLIQKPAGRSMRLVTALFMNRSSIKRRIKMIAKYRKNSPLFIIFALLLTTMIAVTGCTSAVNDPAEIISTPGAPAQTEAVTQTQTPPITYTSQTDDDSASVIGTITFDLSVLAQNEARDQNIQKAAMLYDGVTIAPGESYDLVAPVLPISSWQTAPMLPWLTAQGLLASVTDDDISGILRESTQADAVAGGAELVAAAIANAFAQIAPEDYTFTGQPDAAFMERNITLHNTTDTGMVLHAQVNGTSLAVRITMNAQTEQSVQLSDSVLMASFSLNNSDHNSADRMFNIAKALDMLSGTVIAPGQTLSVNDILGPRIEASGWKAVAGIVGGTYTTKYGGGVSAVSTALYNAAIRAELEIVEKVSHSIPPDYIPGGLDATISTGAPDLKIKNPYAMDITIQCVLSGDDIVIDIYGPAMNYTVDFTSVQTGVTEEPPAVYHYSESTTPDGTQIPTGETAVYIQGRSGYVYDVHKTKIDLDGKALSTELFETVTYRALSEIIYVNAPYPQPTP